MQYEKTVLIGEVAKQCGISVRRVRYLSDMGYIQESIKSVSGEICYRTYTKRHIQQIKRIKAYQDLGYTLKMATHKANEEMSNENK